jgi:hypothetical protein
MSVVLAAGYKNPINGDISDNLKSKIKQIWEMIASM